jgi:hypothetical protein
MLLEAATAILLVFGRPEGLPFAAGLAGLVLVVLIWLSTALLKAPRHFGSWLPRRYPERPHHL